MDSRRRPRVYAQPVANNTQSNPTCVELKNEFLVPARSLKRKKSSSSVVVPGPSGSKGRNSEVPRAENRAPATSKTIQAVLSVSRQSSTTRAIAAAVGPSKKDKGITEETSKPPRDTRRHNVDEADKQHGSNIPVGRHFFTGPLAVAEHERMKKEIETLKGTLHESREICKRQAEQLEKRRAEAIAAAIAMKDREIELVVAKAKSRKNEELLSTIENSVQCQICMDLPEKPFGLNPCGHVLCLTCLQEWFRTKVPSALDDMDVDPDELTNPQYVLMRSKTCPLCRAVVKHRPVPIFMIKSVVAAIKKTKSPRIGSPGRHNSDNICDNPWKGIFTSSEEEADDGDDDEDGDVSQAESDSDDFGGVWYRHSHSAHFEAAVDSVEGDATSESEMENEDRDEDDDEDDDDGALYTQQRWAPPSVSITDYHVGEDDVPTGNWEKLLQRGCSWDMLHSFEVSYSHGSGIAVALGSLDHLYASDDDDDEDSNDIHVYRVFLGWNIALDPDDTDGENYIQEILKEIKDVPEKWKVTPTPGVPFAIDVKRLVLVDEAEEYDNTDTEAWIDNEDL